MRRYAFLAKIVQGGGICPAGGPATTFSSSRMGFHEDGTVKMACSSSKIGVFEDGGGDSWDLALRADGSPSLLGFFDASMLSGFPEDCFMFNPGSTKEPVIKTLLPWGSMLVCTNGRIQKPPKATE